MHAVRQKMTCKMSDNFFFINMRLTVTYIRFIEIPSFELVIERHFESFALGLLSILSRYLVFAIFVGMCLRLSLPLSSSFF